MTDDTAARTAKAEMAGDGARVRDIAAGLDEDDV
jgi:hypothetical protein